MPRGDIVDLRRLLEFADVASHKWDLLVVASLGGGSLRYMELAHELRQVDEALTEGALSRSLRRLRVSGLIIKVSPRGQGHVYALTDSGRRIARVLREAGDDEGGQPVEPDHGTPT